MSISRDPAGGPGAELIKIIPDYFKSDGCQCKDYAKKMDRWRVRGCEIRFDEITDHLVEQAKKYLLPEFASRPVLRRSLAKAIRRAKEKEVPLYPQEHFVRHVRGSLDKYFVAVTALSNLPHHIARQTTCLDSWIDFGLTICAVNTPIEIEELQPRYPQVSRWIESEDLGEIYPRKTQKISRLCRTACDIDHPILLINSDIEIYGDQDRLVSRIGKKSLVAGIRQNYIRGIHGSIEREQWGIDAFVITPKMARTIPNDMPCAIGFPFWDYAIPLHFQSLGYSMEFVGKPLFYHEKHALHWDMASWNLGAAWCSDKYDVEMRTFKESSIWRKSLPFPPSDMPQ